MKIYLVSVYTYEFCEDKFWHSAFSDAKSADECLRQCMHEGEEYAECEYEDINIWEAESGESISSDDDRFYAEYSVRSFELEGDGLKDIFIVYRHLTEKGDETVSSTPFSSKDDARKFLEEDKESSIRYGEEHYVKGDEEKWIEVEEKDDSIYLYLESYGNNVKYRVEYFLDQVELDRISD